MLSLTQQLLLVSDPSKRGKVPLALNLILDQDSVTLTSCTESTQQKTKQNHYFKDIYWIVKIFLDALASLAFKLSLDTE